MKIIIRDEILKSDHVAIADDLGRKVTYRELAESAEVLSGTFQKRGLIFFLCDHHMESFEFIYKILYLNLVPLLLAEDINRELLDNLISIYQPQYIYCKKTYGIDGCRVDGTSLKEHKLLCLNKKNHNIHPDVAVLLSTSGTTGSPKLVKISYYGLYNSAKQVCLRMNIQSGQKGLSPLSMSYVYGLTFCIWHWHCGATLLVTEHSVLSREFSKFFIAEKANHFAGTPYIYQMLQKIHFWDHEKLECLHWAMSAGMQMTERDQIEMVSLMKDKFWIMYGQTECTNFISATNFDKNNIRLNTVGKLLEGSEAVIDQDTRELTIKSKNVSMGYATNIAQLAEGDINQGIVNTGDAAYMDDDGYIYLQGRLSRYVKILGKRVSLDDVEKYLAEKISDAEFACIGTDGNISVFYTKENGDVDKEIQSILDRNMKIPKKFVSCSYLEKIPRNGPGKVAYARLRELA